MVIIAIAGQQATLDNGVWDAPEDLQEDLDAVTAFARRQLPTGEYVPDPDLLIVRVAEQLLHAQILDYTPPSLRKGTVA